MKGPPWRGYWRVRAGLTVIALGVALAGWAWIAHPVAETQRQRIFDRALALGQWEGGLERPMVVAIDRASLAREGPWPWDRTRLASLVEAIAAAGPKAVGIGIFLDGPDRASPAALARRLAETVTVPELARLAADLPDGDRTLATALARVPAVLGLLLDPETARTPPGLPPLLLRRPVDASAYWRAAGFLSPPEALGQAASLGVLALPGDGDGTVRRVPLLVLAGGRLGGRLAPGFALELLRRALGSAPLFLDGPAGRLRAGPLDLALGRGAALRLLPVPEARRAAAQISASEVLAGTPEALARLGGRIVLLGATAPETGALRPGPGNALVADIALQADAVAQLAAGLQPRRPDNAGALEGVAMALGILAAVAGAAGLRPLPGALGIGALALAWAGGATAAVAGALLLLDPVAPAVATVAAFALSAVWVAADQRRRAARLRSAFEQHLAPGVVRRIAEAPESLRLEGETREVTALFTDIAAFTALTERAGPEDLVALLDGYFERVGEIVTDQGGMIDKIVGDAVHALFNVPFDLDDHAGRALACACRIAAASEHYRSTGRALALRMGPTRIGIETGPAIVGNVGGGRKLDYTAHGSAVNAAARIEQANKVFGTAILVGPGTVARLPAGTTMPLGGYRLRGIAGVSDLATPWPATVAEADRAACVALLEADRIEVAPLTGLGVPEDLACRLAELRGGAQPARL